MIGSDARIGLHFLFPSPGYGGSCFPKDVRAITATARGLGYTPVLLGSIDKSNKAHKERTADMIWENLSNKTAPVLACWRATFKAGTDDVREAPALTIIPRLLTRSTGLSVQMYDPQDSKARVEFRKESRVRFANSQYEAVEGADALVLMTEWRQFDSPDYSMLRGKMRGRQLCDLRNRWVPEAANKEGFSYMGIGRNYPLE